MNTYSQLRSLSREQLIAQHDDFKSTYLEGPEGLRNELWRRDLEEGNKAIEKMTSEIRFLTRVIALLTLVTAVAAILAVYRSH